MMPSSSCPYDSKGATAINSCQIILSDMVKTQQNCRDEIERNVTKKLYKVDVGGNVFDYKKEENCPRRADQEKERARRKDEHNTDRTSTRASGNGVMSSPVHKIPLQQLQVFLSFKVPRSLFFNETVLFGGWKKRRKNQNVILAVWRSRKRNSLHYQLDAIDPLAHDRGDRNIRTPHELDPLVPVVESGKIGRRD
jgi:hypothetical protein